MINPMHLQTLDSVCRTGSFAETARVLGYTPSAISQQIQALERALGVQLFEREAHRARPNRIALQIVEASRGAVVELAKLDDEVRRLVEGRRGAFAVATFATASVGFVSAGLAETIRARPGLSLSLIEGEPDDTVPLVVDGTVDLAVVYEYGLAPRTWPATIALEQLADEPLHLLVPAGRTPWAPGLDRLDPDDAEEVVRRLHDAPWISSGTSTGGAEVLERLCATEGFAPRIAFRANNYDVLLHLVGDGLGVAIAPDLAIRPHPGIRAFRLTSDRAFRRILFASRRAQVDGLRAEVTRTLVDAWQRRQTA